MFLLQGTQLDVWKLSNQMRMTKVLQHQIFWECAIWECHERVEHVGLQNHKEWKKWVWLITWCNSFLRLVNLNVNAIARSSSSYSSCILGMIKDRNITCSWQHEQVECHMITSLVNTNRAVECTNGPVMVLLVFRYQPYCPVCKPLNVLGNMQVAFKV